jgi:TP901 family phage tail tape measure protein
LSELIAEARVLVTPDTTTFRSLLVAQTTAAAKGVTVPVTITPVVTNAAAGGQAAQIAGANAAAESAARITSTSAVAARTQEQLARAAELVAVAERRAAAATTEVSAAQTRLGASISATQATQRAFNTSLASTDRLLQTQAAEALVAARSNEVLARSNLEVARTEAAKAAALARGTSAQTASFRQLSTGAGSAAASLLGVRGATLAATGPFLAGAAGAIALSKSIQLATSFNSEIAVLGATTGATGEQLTQAAEAAREFGRDITLPGVTAGDAAKTITEFSKAGLDLNESIAATRGGLQLAQAAQLSYADAVTLTANALNAFGLSGNQAVRVADTLANASNLAQGGIEETALALRQAATAAEVVGVSFEDTTALLTLLAKNGLTGSDAGTALRTAFLRLVNPSKEANRILTELNVNLRDVQGNIRPEAFAEFAAAQADLSVKTQQANAAIVFGQDAFRAFGIFAQEGTDGLNEVQNALGQTGTAARIAGARMTGLAGAQENLSNQLSALGETIGQAVTPALTGMVNQLGEVAAGANLAAGEIAGLKKSLDDLPGPDTEDVFGFLAGSLQSGLRNISPQAAEIFKFLSVLKQNTDGAKEEIKNGGVDLRSAIEDAGREASRGAVSFGEQITGAIDSAFALVRTTLAQAQQAVRSQALGATARGAGQAAGLEEAFDQILAGGGSAQQQIAALQRQAEVQAKIIADAGPNAAGVLLQRRREAQARLASINQQIVGLENQIAAEQKAAQDEAARIRQDAANARDRAFLQQQEDARTAQERRVTLADDTPQLTDDIRRQEQLRALITRQIAALKASAVDEKAKQAAIRALRAERDRTTDAIRELRQASQEQRQAEREELLDAQTAFAQSIFDLTGNKNPLLRAIDREIKAAIQTKNKAKQGSTEWLQARTEINNLLKQRKDLLGDAEKEAAEDAVGGTSLVDLFEQAQDILGGAGNVGFTASGLQGLSARPRIQMEVQERLNIVNDPAAAAAERQKQSTDRLIAAIDQLTQAITGNSTTGAVREGPQNRNFARSVSQEQRFYLQRTAKQMVEQGLVG